jgi:hypothetical protein
MPSGSNFAGSSGSFHPGTRKTQDGYRSDGENDKYEEDAFLRLSHRVTSPAARLPGSIHFDSQFGNGGGEVRLRSFDERLIVLDQALELVCNPLTESQNAANPLPVFRELIRILTQG